MLRHPCPSSSGASSCRTRALYPQGCNCNTKGKAIVSSWLLVTQAFVSKLAKLNKWFKWLDANQISIDPTASTEIYNSLQNHELRGNQNIILIFFTRQLGHTAQGEKQCMPTTFHFQIAPQCAGQVCVPAGASQASSGHGYSSWFPQLQPHPLDPVHRKIK